MTSEREARALSGWIMLPLTIALHAAVVALIIAKVVAGWRWAARGGRGRSDSVTGDEVGDDAGDEVDDRDAGGDLKLDAARPIARRERRAATRYSAPVAPVMPPAWSLAPRPVRCRPAS
jgi:hypothetical protein